MEPKITSTSTKGFLIGLILIVLSLVMYFANFSPTGPSRWIGLLIFVAGIIWAVSMYGKQINYNATFGKYFSHGFKVTIVVTVIMIIFTVLFILLMPDMKEKALDEARKQMVQDNKLTQDQMNQALQITGKFFMAIAIGGALFGYLIFGAIASLIGAAVTKKVPNQFADDINKMGQ